MGEDALPRGDVGATCAAVVACMGLYLGDEAVFVVGGEQFSAALAGHAYGHRCLPGPKGVGSPRTDQLFDTLCHS